MVLCHVTQVVGGPAKGIVVREVDALGGLMGRVADKTNIQSKMLNTAKGPDSSCIKNAI